MAGIVSADRMSRACPRSPQSPPRPLDEARVAPHLLPAAERAGAALSDVPREERYGRHGVYAVTKRALSRKQIKAQGLRNAPEPAPRR
jgi:hypothetical protein